MKLQTLSGTTLTGAHLTLEPARPSEIDLLFDDSRYNKTFWNTGRATPYHYMLTAMINNTQFAGGFVIQCNPHNTVHQSMHLALDIKYIKLFEAFCEMCARWIELTGHIPYTEVANEFPNSQKFIERRLHLTPNNTENSKVYLRPKDWAPKSFTNLAAHFERA